MEKAYPERLIYRFLGDLYNLRKNKEGLSPSEFETGVKNVLKKMKNIKDNDILSEVKAKTAHLTKRFETRIEKEKVKTEKIKEISNTFDTSRLVI